MSELSAALKAVVDGFTRLEIDYIVVGSVAAASWGVVRSTRDVDVVAIIDGTSIDRFLAGLDGSGLYVPSDHARTVAHNGGSFNVVHTVSGGKVDVFVPPMGDAFTASRLGRRRRANVFGIDVYVASAEDVVLAKLRWRLTTRSDVQWRDCVEIAATNVLDLKYLNSWAGRLGIESDLSDLLGQVPANPGD